MNETLRSKLRFYWTLPVVRFIAALVVIIMASLLFAFRYRPAFQIPNFYAEDGQVFTNTVLHKNPIAAVLTGFNGYLIAGLYVLVEICVAVYKVTGIHFYQLPEVIAAVSCVFLGLTVALPYLLLRKQLGVVVSLLAVLFGALVAIPSFDYAIIGTIGNLKFLFLYWAFIFCLYRVLHAHDTRRILFADLVLLLCVLTYAPSMALLPFLLWPYRKEVVKAFRNHTIRPLLTKEVISLAILGCVSAIYLAVVYIKGIPPIPGYLDSPYDYHATAKIAYRVTWYQWLFPISPTMRDIVSIGLIALMAWFGFRNKQNRFIAALAFWAITMSTAAFVINRPGISSYFLSYGPNPDQFFYAQTMIFMLISLWFLAPAIARSTHAQKAAFLFGVFLFIWWASPAFGSYGKNRVIYENLGTAKHNLSVVCKTPGDFISLQTYPTTDWRWYTDKKTACK